MVGHETDQIYEAPSLKFSNRSNGGELAALVPTFLIASATPSIALKFPRRAPTLSVPISLLSKWTDRCSGGDSTSNRESRGTGRQLAISGLDISDLPCWIRITCPWP